MDNDTDTETPWPVVLEDYFGLTLADEKAERWTTHFARDMNASGADIADALLWAAQNRWKRSSAKPTVEDIEIWIKQYRKERSIKSLGYRESDPQGFLNMVWGAMLRAPNNRERWEILCSPELVMRAHRTTTREECDELNQRAENEWPDWDKWALSEAAYQAAKDGQASPLDSRWRYENSFTDAEEDNGDAATQSTRR